LKECETNASAKETLALAEELAALQDIDAENELLHHIRVERTKDPGDKAFAPCSLKFNSLEEFEAATGYWQGRALLRRLVFVLSIFRATHSPDSVFHASTLETESQRLITNLFMSLQYADSCGIFVRGRYALMLQVCMRTLSSLSGFRGQPICRVRSWLAEKISSAARAGKLTASLLSMTESGMQHYP
jgi:hypothetical protein